MTETETTPMLKWSTPEGHVLCRKILRESTLLPYDPHDYQLEGVCKALDGIDLLAITPTGSGKTGFFIMLMLVIRAVARDPSLCTGFTTQFHMDPAMLVLYPAKSLEHDMVSRIQDIKSSEYRPLNYDAAHPVMTYRILVGSYTNEIYTLVFDSDAGRLTLSSTLTVGYHPSWITAHPTDRSIMFAGLEQTEGKVVVLKYDEEGKGILIGEVPSGGADPCSLLALGTELLIANYTSGTFTTIPLIPEPPHLQASQSKSVAFSGTGPNKERQERSHLHQIVFHPSRPELLIPDLGADLTRRFTKGANGAWVPNGNASYKAGSGPRHVVIYDDVLYTVLELTNEVTAHSLPPAPAEATLLACMPTMRHAPPDADPPMFAAEILLAPPSTTFPTPFLYVSNRNNPSPGGDVIAVYSIADPRKPELVAEVRSGLRHLRGMLFGGADDRWLIAGGVHGPGVKMFERVDGGKSLREVAALALEAPTGFLWM